MDGAALRHLLDKQAVIESILRYATGIDMRDWKLYRRVFTDEIEVDFTSWSGGAVRRLSAHDWVRVVSVLGGFAAGMIGEERR